MLNETNLKIISYLTKDRNSQEMPPVRKVDEINSLIDQIKQRKNSFVSHRDFVTEELERVKLGL